MKAARPCALVLDFGGVVTKTMFETHALSEAALGLAPGSLSWFGPFEPGADLLWEAMQRDEISERDYWHARTREVGALLGEDWQRMETFVKRARGTDPQAVVRAEAKAAIHTAHAAGVRLAVLSNELDLFYGTDFRDRLPLFSLFEAVVDATYTKVLKPDPTAYRLVIDKLDLPAEACVFIDDQRRNVEGARGAGMPAVHFDVLAPRRSYAEALGHFGLDLPI